jgi:tetratricopeptide (TPR) repeat protein
MSKNYKEAEKYYSKVSQHTTDLILDIYARLFKVRVNRDGGDNTIDKNVAQLLRMAKQDRYEEYRDIIYYMAGRMQLEGNNIDAALPLLLKSTKYSSNDPSQRNKAFLEVASIYFSRKEYRKAAAFYDSLNFSDPH